MHISHSNLLVIDQITTSFCILTLLFQTCCEAVTIAKGRSVLNLHRLMARGKIELFLTKQSEKILRKHSH